MGKCVDCKNFNCIEWKCEERMLIFNIHKENKCNRYKFMHDEKLKNEIDEALKHKVSICFHCPDIESEEY